MRVYRNTAAVTFPDLHFWRQHASALYKNQMDHSPTTTEATTAMTTKYISHFVPPKTRYG
jgi:hypothetical protein